MATKKKNSKSEYNRKKKARSLGSQTQPQSFSQNVQAGKGLSDIIKEIALQALKDPAATPTEPAMSAALMLATSAWNSALGDNRTRSEHRRMLGQIDWDDVPPWQELVSDNSEQLIDALVAYKRSHYPNDRRLIAATELTPEGNFRVHWTEPDNVAFASFSKPRPTSTRSGPRRTGTIAGKLVRKMKRYTQNKVVDLQAVMNGRKNAEELQKTVANRETLTQYHPAHAMYIYAQNQMSVVVEQLSALKEMDRFTKLVSKAEDEYMPSGPPMSPLTTSFFTCWSFFDACVGLDEETFGTVAMAVGSSFGMHDELLRVMGILQDSKMAVFAHEGLDNNRIVLRELLTDRICKAICPAGYNGRKGELWYARVLPPPVPGSEEYVVFTTPYVLIAPGEREWLSYFQRTLSTSPADDCIPAYERHMKYGPTRNYWNEFVFLAYVNHRPEVIYLRGLPDISESLPHSKLYRG